MSDHQQETIDEIRARLRAATPGHWRVVGSTRSAAQHHALRTLGGTRTVADAEFIAHAPDDIGWLIDALLREREGGDPWAATGLPRPCPQMPAPGA